MSDITETKPAGWYGDPLGRGQRYWNGDRWTDDVIPSSTNDDGHIQAERDNGDATVVAEPAPAAVNSSPKKFAIIGVVAVLLLGVAVAVAVGKSASRNSSATETFVPTTIPAVSPCESEMAEWIDDLNSGAATPENVYFTFGVQDPKARQIVQLYGQFRRRAFQNGVEQATTETVAAISSACEELEASSPGD